MAHTEAPPPGPDLALGVPVARVPNTGVLAGHVDGEVVLLLRREGALFAVGGTCTHYGGPLAEGLVVGDEVRCPWHHACFDLRTGAALKAPAFAALPTWRVEQVGDTVFVREQIKSHAPKPAPNPAHPARVVIIGGGAAGFAAADRLRRLGYAGTLTMLSADEAPPVDRPNLSKDYLAGTAPEDWVPLRDPGFYAKHRIDLRTGCEVVAIDTTARRVATRNGDTHPYDALLIATGAEPKRLPTPGFDLPNVFTLRTFADARAIIAAAANAKTAALIGAGFIGMEAAGALRTRGLDVHVVAREDLPMANVLGDALGKFLVLLHEAHGVVFHRNATATGFDGKTLMLDNGTRIDADLLLVGTGVAPRTALAEAAGLQVDNGLLVDEFLQTSIPGIYAAGDIARYPAAGERARIEHWVHAERQGQAAAANMLGAAQPFTDVPFFWTNHYGLDLRYTGIGAGWDEVAMDGSPEARDCTARFYRGGKLVAAASVGRDSENLAIEAEL